MKRHTIDPRPNWQAEIENLGFDFHQTGGIPYWGETAYYSLTSGEVTSLTVAASNVHKLYILAAEKIITERLYPLMGISPDLGRLIEASWERDDPVVHGRMDFLLVNGTPKLLEYNADSPTALFEASVVQKNWREQRFPAAGQFNNIHNMLVDRWRRLMVGRYIVDPLYLTTATPCPEDEQTVQYMGVCAQEAGWKVKFIPIQHIGWNGASFTDLDERPMMQVFKLYPWSWIMADEFGANIKPSGSIWLEPMWKMLLANKQTLAILWEMFTEHENLLPAFRSDDPFRQNGEKYVRKPVFGQGGNNIQVFEGSRIIAATEGNYDVSPFVYQGFGHGDRLGGMIPNFGVWLANDAPCGLGIRESASLIVDRDSPFAPHIVE